MGNDAQKNWTAIISCAFDNYKEVGKANSESEAKEMAEAAILTAWENNERSSAGFEFCRIWLRNPQGEMIMVAKQIQPAYYTV